MKTQIIVTVDKVLNDASRRILPSQITRELGERLLNVIDVQFSDEPFEKSNPTPTEAEINEAAEKYAHDRVFPPVKAEYSLPLLLEMKAQKQEAKENWLAAIQWLQNYQTHGREKPQYETVEAAAAAKIEEDAKSLLSRSSLKKDERSQTIYILGAKFGANWQASQPNPAIAVIEEMISEYTGILGYDDKIKTLKLAKETILKQMKP